MKKCLYFVSIALCWIAIIFIIGFLLIATGIIPVIINFNYTLGSSVGIPSSWLISAAIVMLLRPFLYRAIFKEQKSFNKTTAIILLIIGGIWFAITIINKLISNYYIAL